MDRALARFLDDVSLVNHVSHLRIEMLREVRLAAQKLEKEMNDAGVTIINLGRL